MLMEYMDKQPENIELGISSIKTVSFNVDERVVIIPGTVQLGYGLELAWNIEESWYEIIVSYNFTQKDDEVSFLNGSVLTRFFLKDIKQYLSDDGKVNLPGGALSMMFGIAFTHTRALAGRDIAGTKFSNYYIPIVNPSLVLGELLKIIKNQLQDEKMSLENKG